MELAISELEKCNPSDPERVPKVGTTLGTLVDESAGRLIDKSRDDYSGISIFARKPKRGR